MIWLNGAKALLIRCFYFSYLAMGMLAFEALSMLNINAVRYIQTYIYIFGRYHIHEYDPMSYLSFYNLTQTTNSSFAMHRNITHFAACFVSFPIFFPCPYDCDADSSFICRWMPHNAFFVTIKDLCRLHHCSWMHFTLCTSSLFETIGLWAECETKWMDILYRMSKHTYKRQRPLDPAATASHRSSIQLNFCYLIVSLKSINHRNLFSTTAKTTISLAILWFRLCPFIQMNIAVFMHILAYIYGRSLRFFFGFKPKMKFFNVPTFF